MARSIYFGHMSELASGDNASVALPDIVSQALADQKLYVPLPFVPEEAAGVDCLPTTLLSNAPLTQERAPEKRKRSTSRSSSKHRDGCRGKKPAVEGKVYKVLDQRLSQDMTLDDHFRYLRACVRRDLTTHGGFCGKDLETRRIPLSYFADIMNLAFVPDIQQICTHLTQNAVEEFARCKGPSQRDIILPDAFFKALFCTIASRKWFNLMTKRSRYIYSQEAAIAVATARNTLLMKHGVRDSSRLDTQEEYLKSRQTGMCLTILSLLREMRWVPELTETTPRLALFSFPIAR